VKQKELQPWTAKINKKQADIDIATSERDALVKKAEHAQEAIREAEAHLNTLQTDQDKKASHYALYFIFILILCRILT
jgi:structural maintenance of chromosome 4